MSSRHGHILQSESSRSLDPEGGNSSNTSPSTSTAHRTFPFTRSAQHWRLIRMHLLDFPREERKDIMGR